MPTALDVTALAFYGVLCSLLAAFAPQTPRIWVRALVGGMVGIVAAVLLPILRGAIGV
ncbi:hypothetical protein [Jannaschia pohangensis]|uniref:Uncharacterized protein n=1 Tax=Jannaschia pohangensis TaxID=390807 RepID=A0A1I3JGP2_9RHOB|nr:hypothetical protein [Jannaschia pohangensis]SFI59431.1 hypothetical protein SAMN04488095_1319 [Jannaschia pohangensis]